MFDNKVAVQEAEDYKAEQGMLRGDEMAELEAWEADVCQRAVEAGILRPDQWDDGDYDVTELAEKLGDEGYARDGMDLLREYEENLPE